MDSPSTNSRLQKRNQPSPTTTKPPLILTKRPEPGPSKPREGASLAKSPTEMQVSHSTVPGSSIDTQPSSLSSRRQTTNQATGSDRRGPGKTQVLPSAIKSSSNLSTKARIAEDMAKGPVSQGQSKYKGMRIPKKVNPPGESRSPVISTTNPQSSFGSPQRALLPRSSNELSNLTQAEKAPLQQGPQPPPSPPPPPPQPEVPSYDVEADRMDVDEPEFVRSFYCCRLSNLHQLGLLPLLLCRKTSERQRICCTR